MLNQHPTPKFLKPPESQNMLESGQDILNTSIQSLSESVHTLNIEIPMPVDFSDTNNELNGQKRIFQNETTFLHQSPLGIYHQHFAYGPLNIQPLGPHSHFNLQHPHSLQWHQHGYWPAIALVPIPLTSYLLTHPWQTYGTFVVPRINAPTQLPQLAPSYARQFPPS
jgi:hypothetical protein